MKDKENDNKRNNLVGLGDPSSADNGASKLDNNTHYTAKVLLAENGIFSADNAKDGALVDEYRHMKRPLLINAFKAKTESQRNANLIMITSALPGEGKTFTTINLAISMAMERDTTVLIVDCDNTRSSLTQAVGLDAAPGIIDLLLGKISDIDEIIVNSDIDKLSVIPAGKINTFSTELFASDRMDSFVIELTQRYEDRIILFDAPPLLRTSQTRVLTHHVGQILIVVEEGKTPQKAIIEAISQIDPKKTIGMVLNKCKYSTMSGYGYYGGYGDNMA